MDPRACIGLVERSLPRIADVTLLHGLHLLLLCGCDMGPFGPLGLLVLGPGIYALDNMLVT